MENPIKMDDLGVPLFLETPMLILKHFRWCFFLDKDLLVDEDDEGKSEIFIVLLL